MKATARVLEVMDTLREQCPWDREQTFASLRNNTIEEAFELTDAITDGDMDGIKEELGDVLLHVVFYSKMADEQESLILLMFVTPSATSLFTVIRTSMEMCLQTLPRR